MIDFYTMFNLVIINNEEIELLEKKSRLSKNIPGADKSIANEINKILSRNARIESILEPKINFEIQVNYLCNLFDRYGIGPLNLSDLDKERHIERGNEWLAGEYLNTYNGCNYANEDKYIDMNIAATIEMRDLYSEIIKSESEAIELENHINTKTAEQVNQKRSSRL